MTYEANRAARRENRARMSEVAQRYNLPNPVQGEGVGAPVGPTRDELMQAGRVYAARCATRVNTLAARDSETCFDIAAKLDRYGSYASQKQADYAAKLCQWAGVTAPPEVPGPLPVVETTIEKAPARPATPTLPVPGLAALIAPDRFARLTVGALRFTLRNDPADLVWVKDGQDLVGVIDRTEGVFRTVKSGSLRRDDLFTAVAAIEVDPARALEDHGQRTGRCGCCGRLLTDPVSVARGIGPECALKGGW